MNGVRSRGTRTATFVYADLSGRLRGPYDRVCVAVATRPALYFPRSIRSLILIICADEAIKWPELNAHGDDVHAPLPTNRTGGAGFETSSQVNLARPDSRAGSVAPSAAASSVELYASRDPYAVPPLPHLNPNMPYRDDPTQYYDNDPYAPAAPAAQGEAYAMTQINRTRSPAPQMAYQGGFDGRASPGPQTLGVDYRARSPGPAASLYAGRASPGPQAGRMSPGPQMAYGQGGGY